MKNQLLLIVTGLIFLACSCSKSVEPTINTPKSKLKEAGSATYTVTGSGKCPSGNKCSFRVDPTIQYGECDCTTCSLIVETNGQNQGSTQIDPQTFFELYYRNENFLSYFERYILSKYGSEVTYSLNNIEYRQEGEDYYILYEYTTSDGQIGTVMYVYAAGVKTQIDCDGSCDTAGETCRERYNFNPPSAECTCQSKNCKMTVTQL